MTRTMKVLISADEHREAVFTVVDAQTGEEIDGVKHVRVYPILKDGVNTFTYQADIQIHTILVEDTESEFE